MIAALLLAATLSSENLGTFFEWPDWKTNNLPNNIPSYATIGSDDLREMRYTSNLVANAYATMEGAYERVYYAFCTDTNKWDESMYGPRDTLGFLRGGNHGPEWDYPTNRVLRTRRFIEADNLFGMAKEMPLFQDLYAHIAYFDPYHWETRWPERDETGGFASVGAMDYRFRVVWSSSILGDNFLPSFDWQEKFTQSFRDYAPMITALYQDKLFVPTNFTYLSYCDRGQNGFILDAFNEVDYPSMDQESPYYDKVDEPPHWKEKYTFATLITNAYDNPLATSISNLTRRILTSKAVTNSFLAAYNQMLGVMDTTYERGVLRANNIVTNFWYENTATLDATAVGYAALDGKGRFSFTGEMAWGDVEHTNAVGISTTIEEGELLRVHATESGAGAGFGAVETNTWMTLLDCPAWGSIYAPAGRETLEVYFTSWVDDYDEEKVILSWATNEGESGSEILYPASSTNRIEVYGGVSFARNYQYRRSCRTSLPPPIYFPPSLQARKTGRVEDFDLAVFSSVATASLPYDWPPEYEGLWFKDELAKWDDNFRSYWRLNTSAQTSWENATNHVLSTEFGILREKMDRLARDFYGVDYTNPEAMIPIPDSELTALKNFVSVTGGMYQVQTSNINLRLKSSDAGDGALEINGWYLYNLDGGNPITNDMPLIWVEFTPETNIKGYKQTVKEKDEFAADGKMAIRTKNKWKWKAVHRE